MLLIAILGDLGLQPTLTKAFSRAHRDTIRDALAADTQRALTTAQAERAVSIDVTGRRGAV